ncbi:hypothetical protein FD755_008043 [Muntiacus reevesi]|uniref:Dystrobrevin beta n=1 Tax=Muntiacus reevesi TaxID=9886 RepID=A0A5J5MJE4_MUNRE|nr:hypothetical protein FD755_008043 [Muntiacus reevesi]
MLFKTLSSLRHVASYSTACLLSPRLPSPCCLGEPFSHCSSSRKIHVWVLLMSSCPGTVLTLVNAPNIDSHAQSPSEVPFKLLLNLSKNTVRVYLRSCYLLSLLRLLFPSHSYLSSGMSSHLLIDCFFPLLSGTLSFLSINLKRDLLNLWLKTKLYLGRQQNPDIQQHNTQSLHHSGKKKILHAASKGPICYSEDISIPFHYVPPVLIYKYIILYMMEPSPYSQDIPSHLADEHALIASYVARLQHCARVLDSPSRLDEEHRLIARYAARLAAEAGNMTRPPTDLSFNFDANKQQRQLIAELENKNREILQEIQRLRLEHEQASQPTPEKAQQNPTLLAELRLLRQRKDELEQRMSALQESRRELMVQLEGLMKLLKAQATGSPHTSPTHGGSRPMPMPVRSTSAGSTPTHCPQDPLSGVGGDMQEAFAQGTRRNLRNDLLVAADSITNTMSSLVKELHSEENKVGFPSTVDKI